MKTIVTDTDRELLITVSSSLVAWTGGLGLFFLGDLLRNLWLHSPNRDRLIGLTGASLTCMVIFLVFYERCRFSFDRRTRILNWSQQRGFSRRTGRVAFGEITAVVLQSCLGNDRYFPKHRVVMLTSRSELPLMVAYEHDQMNGIIAERIREVLGMDQSDLVAESLEALVARGRDLEAIRLLREQQGISLEEAHARIKRIKDGAGSG